MKRFAQLAVSLALFAGFTSRAFAQDVKSGNGSKQSQPSKQPGSDNAKPAQPADPKAPAQADERVVRILDRLEAKGRAVKGLRCDLAYAFVDSLVGDRKVKEGFLFFIKGEPHTKFLVEFNKNVASGAVERNKEIFLFDGTWLTERNDKSKTVIKRQMVHPGEKLDLFEIGRGPFPLPFGQKRDEILRLFKVTHAPFEVGDPPGTEHLHCIPKPGTHLAEKYTRLEIFVDKTIDLPVRIVSENANDGNRIEVDFKSIDTDAAPAGSRFAVETPSDFTVTVENLDGRTAMERNSQNR